MNTQQALQVVKQAIDAGLKLGICPNIDTAAILAQAWQIVTQSIQKDN
jgi:hypothetical protein